MRNRILIACASKSGSTGEVAAEIGKALREVLAPEDTVDLFDMTDVHDLSPYSAVVLGAAVRIGRLLPEAVRFAEGNRAALAAKTTAYFTVCMTMKEDTPRNRDEGAGFLEPFVQIKRPVGLGLFAGKIDPKELGLPWRWVLPFVKGGMLAPGDFRRWDEIRAWATDIALKLCPDERL